MSRYPEFDLASIRTQPFAERRSKVRVEDFAGTPSAGSSMARFFDTLPKILAGQEIGRIAKAIVQAKRAGRAVVVSAGGHVVKTGVSPVLIELMRRGFISALAMNGATAIHDCEIALWGQTSEEVDEGLRDGSFGMSAETADFYNGAIERGANEGLGAGEALGRALRERNAPFAEVSLLAAGDRLGIPVTVHIAIGTDIVHMHPGANGAALGDASHRDFRILTEAMRGLAGGGVLWNLGSAVVLPEALLKAIAILRNTQGESYTGFLGVNFDFIQQYRSNTQVVSRVRAIGGEGVSLTGHHEILVPLLAHAILEADNPDDA